MPGDFGGQPLGLRPGRAPGATSRLTRPIVYASSAGTGRPVRIRSIAGSRRSAGAADRAAVDQRDAQRRQNTPSAASDSATRRSHQSALQPAGHGVPGDRGEHRLGQPHPGGPIGPSPSGSTRLPLGVPMAFRSAPEQNVPPAPQSTATAASGSASKARNASASARAVAPSTAFRAAGRSGSPWSPARRAPRVCPSGDMPGMGPGAPGFRRGPTSPPRRRAGGPEVVDIRYGADDVNESLVSASLGGLSRSATNAARPPG